MMDQLIAQFTNQLKDAINIGKTFKPNAASKISNVVLVGLGGSGIGASIIRDYTLYDIKVPIVVSKNYFLPEFINENTLVVVCSYSGNTEETLYSLEEAIQKKANIACITSGGKLLETATTKDLSYIKIPSGMPPRACIGYSMVQLLYVLASFDLISFQFETELTNTITLLDQEENNILNLSQQLAQKLKGKIPVLYAEADMEGVAIRWRQQINENAKSLTWHHVVPEMNHNELVGWTEKHDNIIVILLRNDSDYNRSQFRFKVSEKIVSQYSEVIDIFSKGKNYLERAFYLIHVGDWLSWYLAEAKNIDASEVKVIDYLKTELTKI